MNTKSEQLITNNEKSKLKMNFMPCSNRLYLKIMRDDIPSTGAQKTSTLTMVCSNNFTESEDLTISEYSLAFSEYLYDFIIIYTGPPQLTQCDEK